MTPLVCTQYKLHEGAPNLKRTMKRWAHVLWQRMACSLGDLDVSAKHQVLKSWWHVSPQRFASDSASREFHRDTVCVPSATWARESQRFLSQNRSVKLPSFRHFQPWKRKSCFSNRVLVKTIALELQSPRPPTDVPNARHWKQPKKQPKRVPSGSR